MEDIFSPRNLIESCHRTRKQLNEIRLKVIATEGEVQKRRYELDSANDTLRKRSSNLEEAHRTLNNLHADGQHAEIRYRNLLSELKVQADNKANLEQEKLATQKSMDTALMTGFFAHVKLFEGVIKPLGNVFLRSLMGNVNQDPLPEVTQSNSQKNEEQRMDEGTSY